MSKQDIIQHNCNSTFGSNGRVYVCKREKHHDGRHIAKGAWWDNTQETDK